MTACCAASRPCVVLSRAEDYRFSSAAAHCGMREDPILSPLPELRPAQISEWSSWLADPEDEDLLGRIRLYSRTGRPIGGDQFEEDVELRLGRRVHALANGRPRKRNSSVRIAQRAMDLYPRSQNPAARRRPSRVRPRSASPVSYSLPRATAGSTRLARRAGTWLAKIAIVTTTAALQA